MSRRQISHTYWQSYTNLVHLPMDPLYISAEALIFIKDKYILSSLVFCGNQRDCDSTLQVTPVSLRKLMHVNVY